MKEDYVSLETAKLLKEKGFDENCAALYDLRDGAFMEKQTGYVFNNYQWDNFITAPTLQMAMKWLREVHNRYVEVCMDKAHNFKDIVFRPAIYDKSLDCLWESDNIPTYEKAAEAAIKYCLENLI